MDIDSIALKKEHIDRHGPPPEALMRDLDNWFRVELTYTSNALEGNTLTRQETAQVLEKGLTVGGKSLLEHLEALNHARAWEWIRQRIKQQARQPVTQKDILEIHTRILQGIDDVNGGCYRNIPVRIAGSQVVLPNPRKVPELMQDLETWLKQPDERHPVVVAAHAHYRLVSIHPFTDGNGRTGRLLMNMILLMAGYPPAIVRRRDRLDYLAALEKAQLGGSLEAYLNLMGQAVERSCDIVLAALEEKVAEPAAIPENLLKIGEVARQSGETVSTIRHWTKEGLLAVTQVTRTGYQLYAPATLERIRKIHTLKKKRYTLQEIRKKL